MITPHYTAVATSTGDARSGGRVLSSDGKLDHILGVPTEMGGNGQGTNPEQLFAAGWAACFHSALKMVAAQRKIKVEDTAVTAEVSIGNDDADGGFGLTAELHVEIGGVDQATAQELTDLAHQTCPYSKATRGNIQVTVEATTA